METNAAGEAMAAEPGRQSDLVRCVFLAVHVNAHMFPSVELDETRRAESAIVGATAVAINSSQSVVEVHFAVDSE